MIAMAMGWLPRMKLSDRITWAVLAWIFSNLLWLRFLETAIPQWVGALVATAVAVAMILYWPRPLDELPENGGNGEPEGSLAGERRD